MSTSDTNLIAAVLILLVIYFLKTRREGYQSWKKNWKENFADGLISMVLVYGFIFLAILGRITTRIVVESTRASVPAPTLHVPPPPSLGELHLASFIEMAQSEAAEKGIRAADEAKRLHQENARIDGDLNSLARDLEQTLAITKRHIQRMKAGMLGGSDFENEWKSAAPMYRQAISSVAKRLRDKGFREPVIDRYVDSGEEPKSVEDLEAIRAAIIDVRKRFAFGVL